MDRDRLRVNPDAVRAHRLRARLSRAELARAAGLALVTIHNLEGARVHRPHMETFRRLSDYFGVHYSAFVDPPEAAAEDATAREDVA